MPQSVKVKSKWRYGRKILKFSKHENHFTPEGKFWPSISISCLYALDIIVSWLQFLFPSLLSRAFEASQLKCLFLGRVPELSPHLHSAPKDPTVCPLLFSWKCLQSYHYTMSLNPHQTISLLRLSTLQT